MGNEQQNKKNVKQSVKVPTAMEVKTYIMVAQNKLTLFRNKKVYSIKQKRTEIGKCLKENNLDVAKAKMDTLIRDEDIITCYDILGPICEILKEKVTYLLTSNQCPPDLRAPLDTIIYASSRLELAELYQLRTLIEMKYGQMYVSKADSNADGLVNINLVEKLKVKPAAEAFIMIRLKQLCKECKINYEFPQEIQPMDFGGDIGGGGNQGFNPYGSNMGGNYQSGQFNNPYEGNQQNNDFGNFNQHMQGNKNDGGFGNFNQQMNQGGFPNNNQGGFPNSNQGGFSNNNQGGFPSNNQGGFPSNSQFGNNPNQFDNPKVSNFGNPYSFNNESINKNDNNQKVNNQSGFGFPNINNDSFPPSNNPSSFGGFPNPNNNNNDFPSGNNKSSFGGFPNPNNNNNDFPSGNKSSFGGFPNPNNNNNDFPSSNNNFPNPNKQSGFPNNSVAFPNSSQMGGDAFNPYASKNDLESSVSDKKFVNQPGEMYKDVPNDKLPTVNSQIKSDGNNDNDFPNPYGQ